MKIIFRTLLSSLCISIATVVLFSSCKDENKGFEQYYNPMGNNPALVIPWMEDLVKSFYKKQAVIQEFEFNDKNYYTAQVYLISEDGNTSPYTIYEDNDEEAVVFFHSDNILKLDPVKDSIYIVFEKEAIFKYLIWKNTPKDGTGIEF